jgi:D-erythrulose 1-phosphate 3-epimerase
MPGYSLGINTCFAVKRWPEPEAWAAIVRDDLGLGLVQHSFDLVDLEAEGDDARRQAESVRDACAGHGLTMHSTFTGLAAYSSNLLLHPDEGVRRRAVDWYRRAIDFTAAVGGCSTGGHVGAFSVSDFASPERRRTLEADLQRSLGALTRQARDVGLQYLLIENLAAAREPSTMAGVEALLTEGDEEHVPIKLCLDVGHQCVPGTSGEDRDPYAWLRRLGRCAPVVQLQQSDADADHHWPFTPATNAQGRIRAADVLGALAEGGADDVALVLEVIPPFEAADQQVLADLVTSVEYWRAAIDAAAGPASRRS